MIVVPTPDSVPRWEPKKKNGFVALPKVYNGTIISVSLTNNNLSAISWMMFLNGSFTVDQTRAAPPTYDIHLAVKGNNISCGRYDLFTL